MAQSRRIRSFINSLLILVLLSAPLIVLWYIPWNLFSTEMEHSPSEVVRNLGLVIGAIIAGLFAFWRIKIADRLADVADRDQLDNSYFEAAKMLGHELMTVRIAAVKALRRLAMVNLETYGDQVSGVLEDFAVLRRLEHHENPTGKSNQPLLAEGLEHYDGPLDGAQAIEAMKRIDKELEARQESNATSVKSLDTP